MNREDRKQIIQNELTDNWCPEKLAKSADDILSRHYPDTALIGASEQEVNTVKQAKEYLAGDDDD
ncbi:hypothetical protein BV372_17360 [Nostoc sp. T09]|uniref:hypothetical protein n=1 Tax=Nostoc sp. T09 TaxID=1932621 RepID=UPI000A3D186C|nr:hypothetical protein [Nostoc sp. T09]OUL33114.1 hypothetical protein BV372_17360 [Nostoc sp. T09]